MAIADIRYTGEVSLILEGDPSRLTGEVSLVIDEVLEPTYVTIEDGNAQGDEWSSLKSWVVEDGNVQGDALSALKTIAAIEDGNVQGDELLSPRRTILIEDGNVQGDEVISTRSDTVSVEDGSAQGDEWATLPFLTLADGSAQGDEFALIKTLAPVEDGNVQGDEVFTASYRTVTLEDGSVQGDEWSLIGLRIVTLEDGNVQGDEVRQDWTRVVFVINADTGAVSRYQFGEAINGAALTEDGLLMSASTGLYALDADTDAGVPIAWSLDTGFSKLGTEYLKRLSYINVLGRFSASPDLRVVSDRYGTKREDRYPMPTRTRTAYRDGRIRIGKGIQSVFYGVGLSGTGPAEIESVQLDVAPLSRRS